MAMQAAIGSLGNISIASLKNSFDEVRAVVYPKNETERKVYEALSSKNWGASTTLMNDIAGDTGDYEKFGIIMTLIWASIETDGKSWKQVFKALTLIDFLVKNGSERVIEACRDKVYKIRSLENFNFYEGALDRGSGVREKSKMIVELLSSNEMIRTEREKASNLRNKFVGIGNDGSRGSTGSTSTGSSYSGGGGGGSYGNSSDRGFGNSYSDSHSSSNGGGHDNYSSNSSGRQIHDSYDSNRGGGGSGSNSNSNGRYRDDEVRFPSETVAAPRKSYEEDDTEVKIKHKPKVASKISAPSVDSAVGGKLKLTIKKGTTSSAAASTPSAVPVPQPSMLDFMDAGDADFMTAPTTSAPQASSNAIMFDAFSTPAATVQDDFGFASFNIAPPVPAPQAAFDPFGMGSAPAPAPSAPVIRFSPAPFQQAPAAPQQSFGQFNSPQQAPPVPQAPMMQSGLLSMQAPMVPQQQQQAFNQYSSPIQSPPAPSIPAMQPAMQQQQQQYSQQPQQYQPQQQQPAMQQQQQQQQQQLPMGGYGAPPAPAPTPQVFRGIVAKAPEPPASFGDFEGSTQGPAAQGNGKWGDIAGLVNLGGISKNESVQAKKQAAIASVSNYTPSSFSGLDGFSKSQSMQQNSTPMNMMRQAPMQQQPSMNVMGGGGGGGGGGGFNMMQGQGQGQGQFQNYGNGIPPGGQMAPNRGMGMAPPQQQQQLQGQGQYGGGMQAQGHQGVPMGMGGGMGMGMGMGMQGSGAGMGMGGQGQGYGQGQGQGQAPNVPAYGYPAQGQNGNFY